LSLKENGTNRFCISRFFLDVPSVISKISQNCFQLKVSGNCCMTHERGNERQRKGHKMDRITSEK
jgi:hypothetical protein